MITEHYQPILQTLSCRHRTIRERRRDPTIRSVGTTCRDSSRFRDRSQKNGLLAATNSLIQLLSSTRRRLFVSYPTKAFNAGSFHPFQHLIDSRWNRRPPDGRTSDGQNPTARPRRTGAVADHRIGGGFSNDNVTRFVQACRTLRYFECATVGKTA